VRRLSPPAGRRAGAAEKALRAFLCYYGGEWVGETLYTSSGAAWRQARWKRDRVQTEVSLWNYFF
jgi:hypothetical protein